MRTQNFPLLRVGLLLGLLLAAGCDDAAGGAGAATQDSVGADDGSSVGDGTATTDGSGEADGSGQSDGVSPDVTQDAVAPDTAEPDTAEPDTAEPDAGSQDAAEDASAQDTSGSDSAEPDAVESDTAVGDAGEQDAGEQDAGEQDAGEQDAGEQDAGDAAQPTCTPTDPPTEVCDGKDNDCNGQTDEGETICTSPSACAVAVCAPCVGKGCEAAPGGKACVLQPANEGGACDDGNACTTVSTCVKGGCAGTVDCDDGVACTTDSCNPATGCTHAGNNGACDDGNSCTTDACDLANGCTQTAAIGKDGGALPCDDGDACTGGSACASGACVGNQPLSCDDGKVCTADTCDKQKGCVHTPLTHGDTVTALCDDGDACTVGDACAAGACKAGSAKCDDGDACTNDACDKGNCVHAAITGCKACKVAGDCDDGKACTTDSCTAGVCKWAPISGCVGPTDYTAKKLEVTPSPIAVGGAATFKLTVENLGKAYGGSYSGKMKWDIFFSKDDKLDESDVKLYTRVWGAYNIGNTKPEATDQAAVAIQPPVGFAHKFVCVRIVFGSDANPADNEICTPVTVNGGEAGLVAFGAGSTVQVKGNDQGSTWNLVLSTDNPGNAAVQPTMEVFISADDKLDTNDKALVPQGSFLNGPSIPAGKQTVTWKFGLGAFNSNPKGKIWVCLRANGAGAAQETNPDDNVLCGQVEVDNPADLHVDITGFSGMGGPLTPTGTGVKSGFGAWEVPWGTELGCNQPNLTNTATGNAVAPFPARCYLVWTNNNVNIQTGAFADAVWSTSWNVTNTIAGASAGCSNCWGKQTITSTTSVAAKTPYGGSHLLCLEVNHDGAVYEANKQNNIGCTPIKITGGDLSVSDKDSSLPAQITAGGATTFRFVIQNAGTAIANVKGKHVGRLLLSKDNKVSQDDVVIWERTEDQWTSYSGANQFGPVKYQFSPDANKPDIPFTVPANTAAGSYYLIEVVNADGALPEPPANNAFAKPVTVLAAP